jgi:hypothetical protein
MMSRVSPAMIEGSPWSRCWSIALNQFQQRVGVGLLRLGRIRDQAAVFLGQHVHAGAEREVVRILGAAVQHHDQRHGLSGIGARHIQLVVAGAGVVGMAGVDELAGQADRGRARRQRRHIERDWRTGRGGSGRPACRIG